MRRDEFELEEERFMKRLDTITLIGFAISLGFLGVIVLYNLSLWMWDKLHIVKVVPLIETLIK